MKKGLRSNSLTRKAPDSSSPQTRKFSELSPETDNNSTKKKKTASMNENEIKAMLADFKAELKTMHENTNKRIDLIGAKLELKIQKIDEDIQQLRNDFNCTKEDIKRIDQNQAITSSKIHEIEVKQNINEQLALENQIMMTNLSAAITKEKLTEGIVTWTDNLIKKHSIKKVNLIAKNKTKKAFIHFTTVTDKLIFMDFVKNKKKDTNDKYIPITNEQIFELEPTDISRANSIEFQAIMTNWNYKISQAIRTAKKNNQNIDKSWIANGSIFLKLKNQTKAVRIDTIEQFENINSSIAMEI